MRIFTTFLSFSEKVRETLLLLRFIRLLWHSLMHCLARHGIVIELLLASALRSILKLCLFSSPPNSYPFLSKHCKDDQIVTGHFLSQKKPNSGYFSHFSKSLYFHPTLERETHITNDPAESVYTWISARVDTSS